MNYIHIHQMPDNWTEQVNQLGLLGKNVLVIGYPGSGKTHLVSLIPKTDHKFIRTDDYISFGFEQSLYECLKDITDIQSTGRNTFVEGVQGYRLLRKGLQTGTYFPDVVIEVKRDWAKIEELYRTERGIDKLKGATSMSKSCDKILNEYLSMPNENKPSKWIVVQNN